MFEYTTKRCVNCLMQEDPSRGIVLNEDNLCSICANWRPVQRDWEDLHRQFDEKVSSLKQGGEYDAALMMSGGKDSAYLAWLLKREYGLRILGITIDNNFEYQETFTRAGEIAAALDIPHLQFKPTPEHVNAFYRFIIAEPRLKEKDCGQLCLYCGKFLLEQGLTFASHLRIPAVFVGYNPEQLFGMGKMLDIETDLLRIRQQEAIQRKISYMFTKARTLADNSGCKEIIPFLSDSEHSCDIIFPFKFLPYDPNMMMETVKEKLGWKPITAFSKGNYIASGCKLLKLMALIAKVNNVSSYMDFEFSSQIRQGMLSKEELKAYYAGLDEDPAFYDEVMGKLGLSVEVGDLAK